MISHQNHLALLNLNRKYSKMYKMDKKNIAAEETYSLAVQNQRQNNLQVAENLYRKTLETNPKHVDAHNNLGIILLQLGKLREAKSFFQQATQINPNYASAHNNLGNAFKKLEKHKKAITCYEKAIQVNPKYLLANYNLGKIFRELGRQNEAIKYFQKNNLTSFRAELLECIYFSDNLNNYKKMLEKLTKQDPLNLRVATMAAYVSKKENIKNIYPFCKNPLNFIFIKNLKNELTSANKFSRNFFIDVNSFLRFLIDTKLSGFLQNG